MTLKTKPPGTWYTQAESLQYIAYNLQYAWFKHVNSFIKKFLLTLPYTTEVSVLRPA
jgi:hypothetical protein